jgi:filamentous hemagglutinin family protein
MKALLRCLAWVSAEMILLGLSVAGDAWSQSVVPDTTLPIPSLVTPNSPIDVVITDGTQAGGNLFHSFSQFSIPTGGSAFFDTSQYSGIQNIISRVTSTLPSNIDGLLAADGTANLFLINPNGIVFGANAQLNLGGSFLASTANSLRFADGTEFSATAPQTAALLTVSVPIGLQYGGTAAGIAVHGATLEVQPGRSLSLVGGNLTLDGSTLLAANGQIQLGGVAGTGSVGITLENDQIGLNFPANLEFADLALVGGSLVSTSSEDGGGNLDLTGRQVAIQDSRVESDTFGAGAGGNLAVNAVDSLVITGSAGDGSFSNGLFSETFGSGDAGDLTITTRRLTLQGEARISAATFEAGRGGNLAIEAIDWIELNGTDPVDLAGASAGLFTGILTDAEGSGSAGNLTINTGRLLLQNGAQVSAATFGSGDSGDVVINAARSVELIGTTPSDLIVSGLFTAAQLGATGNAGNLTVNTARLVVRDGAQIFGGTIGDGDGGNLAINATDSTELSGVSPVFFIPGGLFSAAGLESTGNAGDLTLNTGRLTVQDGAQIATQTFGSGRAGNLTVNARDAIDLIGVSSPSGLEIVQYASGLFSDTGNPENSQSSSNITVTTGQLRVLEGAQIAVDNQGSGNAGNINIRARSILMDGAGGIRAATTSGEGGNITLQLQDFLLMRNGSVVSTDASGGSGNGGNIAIASTFLVALENSDITANAVQGRGGNVRISAQLILGTQFRSQLTPESDITASSQFGVSGVVEIRTPELDPTRGITSLPVNLADGTQLITQGCSRNRDDVANRFTVTGRGGLPPSPEGILSNESVLQDLQTTPIAVTRAQVTSLASSPTLLNPTAPTTNSVIEAQGLVHNALGEVFLIAQSPPPPYSPWLVPISCYAR